MEREARASLFYFFPTLDAVFSFWIYEKLLVILILLLLTLAGCKKYDEGPQLSLRTKRTRAGGSWIYKSILVNGIDSTEAIIERCNYYGGFPKSDFRLTRMESDKDRFIVGFGAMFYLDRGTAGFENDKEEFYFDVSYADNGISPVIWEAKERSAGRYLDLR